MYKDGWRDEVSGREMEVNDVCDGRRGREKGEKGEGRI